MRWLTLNWRRSFFGALATLLTIQSVSAQSALNIATNTQAPTITSSFGENIGTSLNLGGPGWSFSSNLNTNSTVGPSLTNQGLNTGFAFGGSGIHGNLGLSMAQGSSQFLGGTTQSLTVGNGIPGFVQVEEFVPFVTGISPVVGSAGVGYGPVVTTYPDPYGNAAMMMSQSNAMVLNNVQANQAQWNQSRLQLYMHRAQMAMKDRDVKRAKANLALAVGYAPQPLKSQLQYQLNVLKKQK